MNPLSAHPGYIITLARTFMPLKAKNPFNKEGVLSMKTASDSVNF